MFKAAENGSRLFRLRNCTQVEYLNECTCSRLLCLTNVLVEGVKAIKGTSHSLWKGTNVDGLKQHKAPLTSKHLSAAEEAVNRPATALSNLSNSYLWEQKDQLISKDGRMSFDLLQLSSARWLNVVLFTNGAVCSIKDVKISSQICCGLTGLSLTCCYSTWDRMIRLSFCLTHMHRGLTRTLAAIQ